MSASGSDNSSQQPNAVNTTNERSSEQEAQSLLTQSRTTSRRRRVVLSLALSLSGLAALLFAFSQSSLGKIVLSTTYATHHVDNAPVTPAPVHVQSFVGSESVRAFVVGDWGTGDAFQRRVAASMALVADKEHPQCIVSTGDNFYPDGVASADDKQFQTKWKNMYAAASLQVPWYVALGNHDFRSSADAQIAYSKRDALWYMPARYYSVVQKNGNVSVEFFILDTETLCHGSKDDIATELSWFEQALKKSNATWKVAVGHHPIRSHGAYGDQGFMLSKIKPLLDSYHVQAYMNGHDHDMQYLKAADDNFVCLVSGAGGGARNTSYGKNTRFAATDGGFVYAAFGSTNMHVEYYDSQAKALYTDDIALNPNTPNHD